MARKEKAGRERADSESVVSTTARISNSPDPSAISAFSRRSAISAAMAAIVAQLLFGEGSR